MLGGTKNRGTFKTEYYTMDEVVTCAITVVCETSKSLEVIYYGYRECGCGVNEKCVCKHLLFYGDTCEKASSVVAAVVVVETLTW